MISKFSKMQNSVFTKIVLSVTALSFVSLFGVSGYINTANNNKTVIKVDDIELSQSEFNYMLQKEFAKYKAATGEEFDEENDDKKKEIVVGLAQINIENALIENTMRKHNVDFTEDLIRNIIFSTPQFQSEGKFDKEAYEWFLNRSGQSERELITEIKRNLARKILLDSQVAYANVPTILQKQMEKILGQRRTFKYIKVSNSNAKIDREPTNEELDQYYEDLSEEFMVPEKRDISVLYLSMNDIEKGIEVSDEEINEYYKEHIDLFEQPEQRHVLQMIFESEEKANEARNKVVNGTDFMSVATESGQTAEDTDFGFVGQNDLSDELAEIVFSLNKGQLSEAKKVDDTWRVVKVVDIKPEYKMPQTEAKAQIVADIRQEKAYEGSYDLISDIEDKLGAGTNLEDIAKEYNVALIDVKSLAEDGSSDSRNMDIQSILQSQDVRDAAFSYNEGETTQAIEGDAGIVVLKINKIHEIHQQPREEVTAKIKQIWQENERASITQETIDNIEHDLEAGDSLKDVASRYGLQVMRTMPITRGETFDALGYNEMKTLFSLPKEQNQIIKLGDDYIVATTTNIYDDAQSLSTEEKQFLTQALYAETIREMSYALLHDFARNYKIEINYNRMGLTD